MLGPGSLSHNLIVLDSVDSTNEALRRFRRDGAGEGTVVLAHEQTAGKGRMGRSWESRPGLGLYASVLIRPPAPLDRVTRWTLGAAVAAAEACEAVGCGRVRIKWPNDLLVDGRKLAGCLAELRSLDAGPPELILGCGFNVHHEAGDFPAELAARAISLRQALEGNEPEREDLAAAYLERLGGVLAALSAGRWEGIVERWQRLALAPVGGRVRVERPRGDAYDAVTRGLDDAGALIVERGDGSRVHLHLGESVRFE